MNPIGYVKNIKPLKNPFSLWTRQFFTSSRKRGIKNCISYQIMMKFHRKIVESLFPQNSHCRNAYDLALKPARIFCRDGFNKTYSEYLNWRLNNRKDYIEITLVYLLSKWNEKGKCNKKIIDINNFSFLPTISIITPVFNVEIEYLQACINSVIEQLYPYWELCIVDDASQKIHTQIVKNMKK